jgi:hypothetical protein
MKNGCCKGNLPQQRILMRFHSLKIERGKRTNGAVIKVIKPYAPPHNPIHPRTQQVV